MGYWLRCTRVAGDGRSRTRNPGCSGRFGPIPSGRGSSRCGAAPARTSPAAPPSVALKTAVAPATWIPTRQAWDAVEVLRVPERALRHDRGRAGAEARSTRRGRPVGGLTTHSVTSVSPRNAITVVPWIRATSGTAKSRRVALRSALSTGVTRVRTRAGDDGSGHEHDGCGARAAGRARASPSGPRGDSACRPGSRPVYSTIASARSTAENRK